MARFAFTLLAGSLLSFPLLAQEKPVMFAGIPWGADSTTARRQLQASGYSFVEVDEDGDLNFKGTTQGYPTSVYAVMSEKYGLVKVQLMIVTPDEFAFDVYKKMQELLTAKYGTPKINLRKFKYPYEEGDGHEETAVKLNKTYIATAWGPPHPSGPGVGLPALILSITTKLAVSLSYEGVNWGAELDRRESAATAAF